MPYDEYESTLRGLLAESFGYTDALPEAQAELVRVRHYQGFSVEEATQDVATDLGLTP